MSAKPIAPGDYSPPLPEVRHLFGSFAELRARTRARRAPQVSALASEEIDPESLREATRDAGENQRAAAD